MVGWNDTLAAGPITSISFTNAVDTGPELRRSSVVALDLDGSDVEIPNYVIGTAHGRIVLVTADTAVSSAKQILAAHASDVRALAAHPTQPLLAIAGCVMTLRLRGRCCQQWVVVNVLETRFVRTLRSLRPLRLLC